MTTPRQDSYFSDFAAALRYWREKRGYSQLRLSTEADISQRHISFLESGRSQPSRELIIKLGMTLDIPLRQRNVMLLAAGFAPAYQERKLADPELHSVKQALDFMLRQQAPLSRAGGRSLMESRDGQRPGAAYDQVAARTSCQPAAAA
jgi:transcriptional regulator with XRE-family HTH domain